MSKDVELDDDGNIIEEDTATPLRNSDGTFKRGVSGNPNGRRKGSQSKINKTKMVTGLNKHGIKAIEDIVRLGKKAEKEGQLSSALKAAMFIAEKYLGAIAQQDRMAIELQKLRMQQKAKEDNEVTEEEDESSDLTAAIFQFQRAENE